MVNIKLNFSIGKGNGNPLQYSCLENPVDGGAWWAAVYRVVKSRTQLNDFTLTFHFYALEKEMATHSSVLAWRIPGTGEPGGLPSLGSHRVGHDWSDLAAAVMATLERTQISCGAHLTEEQGQEHQSISSSHSKSSSGSDKVPALSIVTISPWSLPCLGAEPWAPPQMAPPDAVFPQS